MTSLRLLLALLVLAPDRGGGVVLMGTGDPSRNTTAPTGELAGSGWQYQGEWGRFLGTVIGPRHFITSGHIGGAIGDVFRFRGSDYTTTACHELGDPDLRIWEVCGILPAPHAPLYPDEDEKGRSLVVFGRGTRRGAPVFLDTPEGSELRGWRPGAHDHRQRWGTNIVTDTRVFDEQGEPAIEGVDYLVVDFDRGAGFDEAALSVGDSGGAVFIRHREEWCLAGINHAVDGPFRHGPGGEEFPAFLFDARGFQHLASDGRWGPVPDQEEPLPTAFYSIRISRHRESIRAILDGLVPPDRREPQVLSSSTIDGIYTAEFDQVRDPELGTVSVGLRGAQRFYRLAGCARYAVSGLELQDDTLVLHYRRLP